MTNSAGPSDVTSGVLLQPSGDAAGCGGVRGVLLGDEEAHGRSSQLQAHHHPQL
jgi:hypothetical protein